MKVYSLWNPAQELATLHNRMANCYHGNLDNEECPTQANWTPAADVFESETDYKLALELPGIDRKDIDVKLENHSLQVSGERKCPETEGSWQGNLKERAYGKFSRRFSLPKDVDNTQLAAEFKDGLLQVTLPKKKESQPRSIDIQGS